MSKFVEDTGAATVALAALTKMVSLLAAELVVGQHSDDMDALEFAMRAKLFATIDGVSPETTAAGISLAHTLVNPVLKDLRLRVEAKALGEARAAAGVGDASRKPTVSRKLN